ncbi:nitrate reductase molybdenum cofactor assembly chaperone [Veillonella caviae]|uniref:nitrate reductase molybdenum cofactor assembly chaperone n=1 Tax=Veillonella caviae TaxID=248316 RepID=UPI002A913A01|nr:nitrate reductase molybdenum cofactor assembly chaperone [Veillonella caviae]MDD7291249.1 nitrate reductase molybdenum cofactor assembly chaperone [Veillonella caviae]MDY5787055.1 nitrate reductase molybdenum cofactor assembly chaperone [Veillonella caviae]
MKDAQKIALIASFLLRYPDATWYDEIGEWKADTHTVGHPQLRQGLLEFFDYIEEMPRKAFEDQYVRTFDFSQNTTMYLSTYELQGTGEQAEELVKFKAFFLENDYDLPKEMPDYIPALLELCAVIDEEKAREIYDYCKPKLEYIRERFIEAKLPYAFLFDIILSVANGLEDDGR